jgi:hypothetical protein
MNDRSDEQRLLNDVLAEGAPEDFRAALLGETLRQARARRRRRQWRRAAGGLAVLLLAAGLAWQSRPQKASSPQPQAQAPAPAAYRLVQTQPLSAGMWVDTASPAAVRIISSAAPVTEVVTDNRGFKYINDAQLLALLGPRPAVLIRTGPDAEELVLAGTGSEHDKN